MSFEIEFGSKSGADAAREEHAEYVCPVDDDRRLKTVAFVDDTPDLVRDQLEAGAQTGRAEREQGAGQADLTDAEKNRVGPFTGPNNYMKAASVKALLRENGVSDWEAWYDPELTVDEHKSSVLPEAQQAGGGDRIENEGPDRDAAARAEKAAGEQCDHAKDHCEHGDPEACEFLRETCGYDSVEVDRILSNQTEDTEQKELVTVGGGEYPEMEVTPEQAGALSRSWSGYKAAIGALDEALGTVRESIIDARQAMRAINSVRSEHGQEEIHPDRLHDLLDGLEDLPRSVPEVRTLDHFRKTENTPEHSASGYPDTPEWVHYYDTPVSPGEQRGVGIGGSVGENVAVDERDSPEALKAHRQAVDRGRKLDRADRLDAHPADQRDVLEAARAHKTDEQSEEQARLVDDVEPEAESASEEHRRAQNNGYLRSGSRGFEDEVSSREGLGQFAATGGEETLDSFEADGGTKQRQPPLATSPTAALDVRQAIRTAGRYNPTDEYDELEDPSGISAIGSGRRKTLDAIDAKGRLDDVQTFNTVEKMIDAVREISLAHRDGRTYMAPPDKPIRAIENVYANLPEDAKREFLNDDTLHRRINAARKAFNDWMGKKRREQKMPSPVEAGPSNYPAKKARETSRYAREAKDELKERIKKIRSAARGGRQRALQAIGSSVAEQNEKEAQSEIERMREKLEPGDLVLHFTTRANWQPWGVKRVNKKSVRLKRPHPDAGMEKAGPYENGTYPEYDLTTVDLDSKWLRYIPPESIDTLNEHMEEFADGNVGPHETFDTREDTLRHLMGDGWVDNHSEVLDHE